MCYAHACVRLVCSGADVDTEYLPQVCSTSHYLYILCVYVYEWRNAWHVIHVETRGQPLGIGSCLLPRGSQGWTQVSRFGSKCLNSLSHPTCPLYLLLRNWTWSLPSQLDWLNSKPGGSSCLHLPRAVITNLQPLHLGFHMGAGEPNSCPCTSRASTSLSSSFVFT